MTPLLVWITLGALSGTPVSGQEVTASETATEPDHALNTETPPPATAEPQPDKEKPGQPTPQDSAALEARRTAAEKRYTTGMTPEGVKGLWCGLQLGALAGTFEGYQTAEDFFFFAGSLSSLRLGFVYSITDRLAFQATLRMARTGAMFHNSTGIQFGVRAAPLGDGKGGVPATIGLGLGVVDIPGFMAVAWQEDLFPTESIHGASALGTLRLDIRVPLTPHSTTVWYASGELSMDYDLVRHEVYGTDLQVERTTRANIYSSQYLVGIGTGYPLPGRHLNLQVDLLGGALTYPSDLGEMGGTTGVALIRIGIAGLSEDDLRRTATPTP